MSAHVQWHNWEAPAAIDNRYRESSGRASDMALWAVDDPQET
jgi:hypothetical protein